MPWTESDYPDSLKNLNKPLRKKAIEIANALVRDEGYPDGRAIAIATSQAEQWAEKRGIALKRRGAPEDSQVGRRDGGRQVQGDAHYHVLPHERGWAIRFEDSDRAIEVKATKREAIDRAVEIARNKQATLAIHTKDGAVQETRNYASPPPRQ